MIELDAPLGDDDRAGLQGALRTAASSGMYGRPAGEDSPRWTATVNQAAAPRKRSPLARPARTSIGASGDGAR